MRNSVTLLLALICMSWLVTVAVLAAPVIDRSTEIDAIESTLIPAIQRLGHEGKPQSIAQRMQHHHVPGISVAVVKDGEIRWAKAYGVADSTTGAPANDETLFQAASISKPMASLGTMALAEKGTVNLDADVNAYLTSWKLPQNNFTSSAPVTLRALLSHLGGATVTGYPGYRQTDPLPTLVQILNGDGNIPAVEIDQAPGSSFRYSGGGYNVAQQAIEDASGQRFAKIMQNQLLNPLDMNRSTYDILIPATANQNISSAHDEQGRVIEGGWRNYPESAGGGLWSTPSDLARVIMHLQQIMAGRPGGIVTAESLSAMLTPTIAGAYGMGFSLYEEGAEKMFGHTGTNEGFKAAWWGFVHRGEGYVILTNGRNGGELIRELESALSDYYDWGFAYPVIREIELTPAEIKEHTGVYGHDGNEPQTMQITRNGNVLLVRISLGKKSGTKTVWPSSPLIFHDDSADYAEFYDLNGNHYVNWFDGLTYVKLTED